MIARHAESPQKADLLRTYEAGHIRERATPTEMHDRYEAIFEIAREHQPTGVRFLFYSASARGIVPKNNSGYVKVQRAILAMRREHVMPWAWIVDSHRWRRAPRTFDSVEDALQLTAQTYRRALWSDADTSVEVWCESESVAGVLHPVTDRWDVALFPIKGQTSESFAYAAAQEHRHDPRRILILYFGDHDPAGYEIETNLRAKLTEHSGRDDLEWERLACTQEDVTTLRLSGTAPKKTSWRNAITGERIPWHGPAVEVEAIDPPLLRAWLDQRIAEEIDPHRLQALRVAEASERDILTSMAGGHHR